MTIYRQLTFDFIDSVIMNETYEEFEEEGGVIAIKKAKPSGHRYESNRQLAKEDAKACLRS
jgi:hypothetical protein